MVSVLRLSQTPLQFVSAAWHERPQTPAAQTCPAAHAVPQVPQLWLSVCRLSQTPLQAVRLAWQESVHAPLEQTAPAAQTVPQVPQLLGSFRRLSHVPLQLLSPAWQERLHVPTEQAWPAMQALPALAPAQVVEAPQYRALVAGSTHDPLQLISVPGQDTPQTPALQAVPAAHGVPFEPTLFTPQPAVAPQ